MKKTATTFIITSIFTLFAATVLLYVSLAVMIGPWIDPTLALCALGILSVASWCSLSWITVPDLMIATAAGSMGGLIASAAAWSIPTLYFTDPTFFSAVAGTPLYFIVAVAALICVAGCLGFCVAWNCTSLIANTQQYPFPIAQLVVRTMTAFGNLAQLLQLACGALLGSLYHIVHALKMVPHALQLVHKYALSSWLCIPAVTVHMGTMPMLCALGFIAGNLLVVPLLCGIALRILFIEPCYRVWFAAQIHEQTFITSLCAGLILQGVLYSFWKLGAAWCAAPRTSLTTLLPASSAWLVCFVRDNRTAVWFSGAAIIFVIIFLHFAASLSFLASSYVVGATIVCTYEVICLLGRIGLAPLGRFATFVMVPGMMLFRFTSFQSVAVAAFVELTCAVGATVASGMRIAREIPSPDNQKRMARYQGLALVVSALGVGVVLWLFARYVGFGTSPLFAQRAQSRALLIRAHEMRSDVLCLGVLVGLALHALGVNTTLLLGGVLLALSDSMLLIIGGALSRLWRKPQTIEPFWSGIFVASSLWMMSRIFLG